MGLKELVDEQMAAYHQGDYADHGSAEDMLTRFANAVAAVEREECARVCHLYAVDNRIHSLATRGAHDCEKAIRMRSNVRSQATDAALSRQVACTDGLGVAVPPAPTFENGGKHGA